MARPGRNMAQMQVAALALLACLSTTVLSGAVHPVLKQFKKQTTIVLGQVFNSWETGPSGLAAITFTKGTLKAGNFLATNWAGSSGLPGRGRDILQITPSGAISIWATINIFSPNTQRACGSYGVGLTMALVVLSGGFVVVGSIPIAPGHYDAGPGCLLLLDSFGNVLDAHAANETTAAGTYTGGGPWAMAVSEFNNGQQANLFVSYVLGNDPKSLQTLTGPAGGMVVRYSVQVPANPTDAPKFWGSAPTVIASGFPTRPGNIGAGHVGPGGLLVGKLVKGMSYGNALNNSQLFIANTLVSQISVVSQSTTCNGPNGPTCSNSLVASDGLLNMPIGLGLSPVGTIVAANRGVGTLAEVAPTPLANKQLASKVVDTTPQPPGNGFGSLFNVLFHPSYPKTLIYNNDAKTTINILSS